MGQMDGGVYDGAGVAAASRIGVVMPFRILDFGFSIITQSFRKLKTHPWRAACLCRIGMRLVRHAARCPTQRQAHPADQGYSPGNWDRPSARRS
jgi:hypothetical protein